MGGKKPDGLARRLREAGAEELALLVKRHIEELDALEVRQLLLNPFVTSQIIETLMGQQRLIGFYEVRKEIAHHPRTPEILARRLIPGLYWRDLLQIGSSPRAAPRVRRSADLQLTTRLPGLAIGERISIARRAGPTIIRQLLQDPEVRVIEALLENPRLTEGALMPLVASDLTRPETLTLVARHRIWGIRYPIRAAVCKNLNTHTDLTLGLLASLKKGDLMAIERNRRLPSAVRRKAATLLGRPLA
jgi:hypothetical protein